jgi:hypothetical protein
MSENRSVAALWSGGRRAGTAQAALVVALAAAIAGSVTGGVHLWLGSHPAAVQEDRSSVGSVTVEQTVQDAPQPAPSSSPVARIATAAATNVDGGYRFRYPPHWRREEHDSVSRVTNRSGHLVVTFGLGPRDELKEAFDTFSSLLEKAYAKVTIARYRAESVLGEVALRMRGRAVNDSGDDIRFEALLIEQGQGHRPALGAFAASDAGAGPLPQAVREILVSLEPTSDPGPPASG